MKKLFTTLITFLTAGSLLAADFSFCTCTVTNATDDGDTIVVKGSTRTWKDTVATPSSQIATDDEAGGVATNLFNHFGQYGIAGVTVQRTDTNVIRFLSFDMTASVTGDWATMTCTTNVSTNVWLVHVPFSTMAATNQTNVATLLVTDLNTHAQNALNQNSNITSELVGLANAQTISGVKSFTGANTYANASQFMHGGTLSNMIATNLVSFNGYIIGWVTNTDGIISGGIITNATLKDLVLLSGNVSTLTNGGWIGANLTNAVNRGNAFSSPGSPGSNAEQFGSGALATNTGSIAFGRLSVSSGTQSIAIGQEAQVIAGANFGIALGYTALANSNNAIAIGAEAAVGGENGIAIGAGSAVQTGHTNAVVIGYGATSTAAHEITIGNVTESINLVGVVKATTGYTNAIMLGTNVVTAGIGFTRLDNTSLANGNNAAVDIGGTAGGSRTYVKGSGPTAAFNINGIAGGWNGRYVKIQNASGFNMTIANDSGVDPTAANRIITGTGADVTITNAHGFAEFIYDSAQSRWIMENQTMTAIAGVTSVALTAPTAVFDVAGSPITGTGTLAITFDNQSANTVFAGPASGAATTPAFRALVADDIPIALNGGTFANGITNTANTASRALVTDADKGYVSSATTATEVGYLSGVTSAIQTQLDAKAPTASPTFTGTVTADTITASGTISADGYFRAITTKTTTYTVTSSDSVILADGTAGAFTVTLPTAAGITGRVYTFKKTDSTGNAITVDGDGAETIDGSANQMLLTQYDTMTLVSDGTNWHVIEKTLN